MGVTGTGTVEGGGRSERGRQRSTVDEKAYVGMGCVRVMELLQGGGCQLGLAPTTFVMEKWGVRVGVEGNVPGQYELGNLLGEKNHQ